MFYVVDDKKNLIEAYDKEGVLSLLAQAIQDGSLEGITADSAFISKIKCCVSGITNKIAFVTQAKYNELLQDNKIESNTYYYITDDTTAEDIEEQLAVLTTRVNESEIKLAEEITNRTNADNTINEKVETYKDRYSVRIKTLKVSELTWHMLNYIVEMKWNADWSGYGQPKECIYYYDLNTSKVKVFKLINVTSSIPYYEQLSDDDYVSIWTFEYWTNK